MKNDNELIQQVIKEVREMREEQRIFKETLMKAANCQGVPLASQGKHAHTSFSMLIFKDGCLSG